ncbi:hypothetical protein QLX08_011444 [Tetragonisca angustula]|uniref:Uncharacterized protein n=1 Tax=Tetragonisca angustula TaxID=166442 RepID=A0AAW0ZAS2_9HYME
MNVECASKALNLAQSAEEEAQGPRIGGLERGRFTIRQISFLEGLGFPSNPITRVKCDLGSWPYAAHHETPWAFRISSGQIPTAVHWSCSNQPLLWAFSGP